MDLLHEIAECDEDEAELINGISLSMLEIGSVAAYIILREQHKNCEHPLLLDSATMRRAAYALATLVAVGTSHDKKDAKAQLHRLARHINVLAKMIDEPITKAGRDVFTAAMAKGGGVHLTEDEIMKRVLATMRRSESDTVH